MKNKKSIARLLIVVMMLLCITQMMPKNSKEPLSSGSASMGIADGGSAETNGGITQNAPSFVKLNSRFTAVTEHAGYSRYLEHNQRTVQEDLELNLAEFEDVHPYMAEDGDGYYVTYSGHMVYEGRHPGGYYWGKSPDEPFLFFISGSQPIPLNDHESCSNVNSFVRNTGANLYVEGQAQRVYGVYNQEDIEEFHQHYAAGQAVLLGEVPTQKGQLVLDGRLIPCTWQEIDGRICIPMTDFVKYLYTESYVDEKQHLIIVYSTSVYGVQSGVYTFFTAESPEYYLEDFPAEPDGTLRYYSHTVEGEYLTLDLAFGEKYWLPLDTLQAAFGWDAYLDTEGNLLMIVTDPSNVTDLVTWLPRWN